MIQIRRSYVSLVYVSLFLILIIGTIQVLPNDLMLYTSIFWMFGLIVTIVRRLVYWKYIIIKDDQITLHADFKTERFPKEAVTKLFFQADPFQSSYFQLRSGKKIRFNSFGVPRSELIKLKSAVFP